MMGPASTVQPAHPRIAAVGEHQPARHAHPDHLVVQQIRRHPDQLELASTLSQYLVARGERDQVREPLERHAVAIADEVSDGFPKRRDLGHQGAQCERLGTMRTP